MNRHFFNYILVFLLSIFLYFLISLNQKPGLLHVDNGHIEQETKNAGQNYYSYLTYSIYNSQLSLIGPYHPDLEIKYDPFSSEALTAGVIIMDASYYNKKYFLYWGLAPIILYVSTDVILGFVPSDLFISRLILVFILISTIIFFKDFKNFIYLFIISFFNPYFVCLFLSPSVHSISRTFAILSLIISFGFLYRGYILPSLFFSLIAVYSKHNFLLSSFLLFLFVIYNNKNKIILYFWFYFLLLIPLFIYNYIRFDNLFEFGIRYITNSGPSVPYGFSYNIFKISSLIISRLVEYFFTFPLLINFNISPNPIIYWRVNNWFFSEGNIGIFWSIPVIFLFIFDIFNKIIKSPFVSLPYLLIIIFIANFLMLSFFMMSTIRYAYEFLLPLFLFFFICSKHIKMTSFKILLIIYSLLFLSFYV